MSFKQESKKSNMKKMKVTLGGETNEELIELLDKVSFEFININLSMRKSLTGTNENATGFASVGFVNKFNKEDNTFDVVVFENRLETIKSFGDVEIIVRVFKNKEGKITKIIGLDIEPVSLQAA